MRQTIYIPQQKNLLFSLSEQLGISVSELIRECIEYALSSEEFRNYLGYKSVIQQIKQKKQEIKAIRKIVWELLEAKEQLRVAELTLEGKKVSHKKKYVLWRLMPPEIITLLMKKEDELVKLIEQKLRDANESESQTNKL